MMTIKELRDLLTGTGYVLIDYGDKGLQQVDFARDGLYNVKGRLPVKRPDVPDGFVRCVILGSTKCLAGEVD